nr:hypothetical protein [Peribacillus kribbensis]
MEKFHCCASCIHFRAVKAEKGMKYYCSRLCYETHPKYQFNCWVPKEKVAALMKKKGMSE